MNAECFLEDEGSKRVKQTSERESHGEDMG